jgi:predicted O-linked N-acetylglucosamine transferase (SPINDLY family)
MNFTQQDISEIKKFYKQCGLKALSQQEYDDAIKYFNLWQYTYANYLKIDRYEYDLEILNTIENKLLDFKLNLDKIDIKSNEKIRIVYICHGILDSSSIIPKILLSIIKNHDISRFEIYVFTIESRFEINKTTGKIFLKQFDEVDCKMHYASFFRFGFSRLHSIATKIHNLNPHILITMAALAGFDNFFISAFKPAPIRIGFVLGSPAQFIPPSFDFGITWVDRLASNCPVPCLNSGIPYFPQERSFINLIRTDYNLPSDAIIISSAGRYTKFQDATLLNLIVDSMHVLPNLYYIVIGLSQEQLTNLYLVPEKFRCRIYIFDWSQDYEKYLTLSDIYLDTYPSGGGITLYDAALLKLPIISFTDSNSEQVDQSDWNPASELFLQNSLILVDRNNISDLKLNIEKLYYDKQFREEMGGKAYTSVIRIRNSIKDNIKNIESLYIKLVNERYK